MGFTERGEREAQVEGALAQFPSLTPAVEGLVRQGLTLTLTQSGVNNQPTYC